MNNNWVGTAIKELKKNDEGVFRVPQFGDVIETFYITESPISVTIQTHRMKFVVKENELDFTNEKLRMFQNLPIASLCFDEITIKVENLMGNQAKVYAVYKFLSGAARTALIMNPQKVCVRDNYFVYAYNGELHPYLETDLINLDKLKTKIEALDEQEALKLLETLGDSLNLAFDNNWLLCWAAEKNYAKVVQLLRERAKTDKEINPGARDNDAICRAAVNGNTKVVELMLEWAKTDKRIDPGVNNNAALLNKLTNQQAKKPTLQPEEKGVRQILTPPVKGEDKGEIKLAPQTGQEKEKTKPNLLFMVLAKHDFGKGLRGVFSTQQKACEYASKKELSFAIVPTKIDSPFE